MHLKLQVVLDLANKAVSGTATHHVAPLNDGTSSFELDAVDMEILTATVDKQPARFDYDGRKLRVHFGSTPPRGTEVRVAVEFCSRPRIGLYFIQPDEAYPDKPRQVWSQGQDEDHRYWFPCYDHTNDKMTSELMVTVPSDWYALSNGRLLEDKKQKDGTRRFHWHQDRPHSTYLFTLAAGEFSRIDATRDGLTIDYFVEPKDVEAAERTFGNTPEMIALFEEVSGVRYPWAKYSQVVVRDFVFGGMENTSATTMTELILVDRKASLDHTSDYLVSHELAHQWWGDLMTCRDWSHGWLNESFATYAEFLWEERKRGADEYRQYVIANTHDYLEERYRRPIVTNVWNAPIDIFDLHLYEKGALVLHTLRGLLGDDQFLRSIRRYCQDNQERSVITQDLMTAIEAETGRNLDWFFDQYVFRPGHPQFKVSWNWDDAAKLATVSVRQTQSTDDATATFRIPVTIDFRIGRARPHSFAVEVTEKEHTFVFPSRRNRTSAASTPTTVCSRARLRQVHSRAPAAVARGRRHLLPRARRHGPGQGWRRGGRRGTRSGAHGRPLLGRAGGRRRGPRRDEGHGCPRRAHPLPRRATPQGTPGGRHRPRPVHGRRGCPRRAHSFRRPRPLLVRRVGSQPCHRQAAPSGWHDVLVRSLARRSFREIVRVGASMARPVARRARLRAHHCRREVRSPQHSRAAALRALGSLGQHFESRKKATAEEIARFLDDPTSASASPRPLHCAPSRTRHRWTPRPHGQARARWPGVRVAREVAAELRKGLTRPASSATSATNSRSSAMRTARSASASTRWRRAANPGANNRQSPVANRQSSHAAALHPRH
jgi:aminopeptidase N